MNAGPFVSFSIDGNTQSVPNLFAWARAGSNVNKILFFSGLPDGFRSDGLDLQSFCGNSALYMKRLNVFRGHAHRAQNAMLAYFDSAHHRGVISDARAWADLCAHIFYNHAVIQIVLMGVNVGVI